MSTTTIVVGFDGSPEAGMALRWALDEAEHARTRVSIVYAWAWPNYMPAASMVPDTSVWPDAEAEETVKRRIHEALVTARADHPGLIIDSAIDHGPAALVLRDHANHADLLVVGGRSHAAFVGLLLGSVASAVAVHASCSVVVVRGSGWRMDRQPVVVGLDDSALADTAARFAFEQAATRGVPLRVVRAWMPPRDLWIGAPLDRDAIHTAERRALRELVTRWQEKYPAVPVTLHVVVDHPYRVLADAARDAQLTVVAARGRGGFAGLRLGSVSRYLLHHTAGTVAVVRDRDEQP